MKKVIKNFIPNWLILFWHEHISKVRNRTTDEVFTQIYIMIRIRIATVITAIQMDGIIWINLLPFFHIDFKDSLKI